MCLNTFYFNDFGFCFAQGSWCVANADYFYRLALNLLSPCLSTPECWDNSPVPLGLA